jgi:hypothetical protein
MSLKRSKGVVVVICCFFYQIVFSSHSGIVLASGILMTASAKCAMVDVLDVTSEIESTLKRIGELRVCSDTLIRNDKMGSIPAFARHKDEALVGTTFVSCLKKQWGAHNFEFSGRINHINGGSLLMFKSADFRIEIRCEYLPFYDSYGIYFSCEPNLKPELKLPNSMKNDPPNNIPAPNVPKQPPPSSSLDLCSCCSYLD